MKKIIFLIFSLCFWYPLIGQVKEKASSNAISTKLLFIDYGRPNNLDGLSITNGLEFGYLHNFNRFIGIGIPLKLGVANVFEDINNRTVVSVDGVLRLQYQRSEDSKVIPYLMAGAGVVTEVSQGSNLQYPLGGGLQLRLGKNSYADFQLERRKSYVANRDNLQFGLGYVYLFGSSDRDRDGIADDKDACPDIAGTDSGSGCPDEDEDGVADQQDHCPLVPGIVALSGCPDADGDGVADHEDRCPNEAGSANGCPDADKDGVPDQTDNCPDSAGPAALNGCPDSDGDGITDAQDECPDVAGIGASSGCPDRDRDGIPDQTDKCPDVPGSSRTGGCPDRDGDGVADADDRCPDVEGPYSGCPDTDGDGLMDADDRCPDNPGLITNQGCPEIDGEVQDVLDLAMGSVQFNSGQATLLEPSFQVLDQIVAIMGQYPDYSMSITGHTDNQGDDVFNQQLSEQRAKACYDYLTSQGIAAERLSYRGYGDSMPISDNTSSFGRMLNRRVEFNMYIP